MKKTFVLFCVLILIVLSYGIAVAAPPDKDVVVTNTSSNPIPVTGNVAITGTPNVNVTNTVPVTGNVAITGTPNVNVTNTVSTINAENPALSPFWGTDLQSIPATVTNVLLNMGAVPSGERLVIEHVGVYCYSNVNDDDEFPLAIVGAHKKTGSNSVSYFYVPIPMSLQGMTAAGRAVWTGSQAMRLYSDGIDSSHPIYVDVQHKNLGAPFVECTATLSGYTVSVP